MVSKGRGEAGNDVHVRMYLCVMIVHVLDLKEERLERKALNSYGMSKLMLF